MGRAHAISLPEYREFLSRLWPTTPLPRRLGIALSGGVDSMALAYLTHKLVSQERRTKDVDSSIHAFIVDHKAREESSREAESVANIARRDYGFDAHVLPLTWDVPPQDLKKGFETRARIARYRALARACVEHRVGHLLLAHHADDQAETVMMRLLMGSGMEGLAGIRAVVRIPESRDVFGASQVFVGRPFLGVEKERLRATCEENSVGWFEDRTNRDVTYTRRNAIRKLLNSTTSPSRLPRALQRASLISLASVAQARSKSIRDQAQRLLKEECRLDFDSATGSLQLELPENSQKCRDSQALRRLLIDVAESASPLSQVDSRSMEVASACMLCVGPGDNGRTRRFTAAGLKWNHTGGRKWTVERQQHTAQTRELANATFTGCGWSEWQLWDGRWWIRVNIPPPLSSGIIVVRPLEGKDMKVLREKAKLLGISRELGDALMALRGDIRFVVPAIFERSPGGGEDIVALPTVQLTFSVDKPPRILEWEVRFKGIEGSDMLLP